MRSPASPPGRSTPTTTPRTYYNAPHRDFKGDAADVEDATRQLVAFIASLNVELGEPINRGYPHILLGREH